MHEGLDESVKFKRQMRRAFIILAVVEFIVTAYGVFYYLVHK